MKIVTFAQRLDDFFRHDTLIGVDSSATLLNVENLTLGFGGTAVLNNVSFSVQNHEIRAIIGPNGAGKTSILNCISGFYRPQEGRILYRDTDLTKTPPYKIAPLGVARTFQNIALYTGLSTLDNLMAARHIHMKQNAIASMIYWGPGQKEEVRHREVVEEIIEFLEIEHIRKAVVGALPYGLRKRVELGRALALEPDLLLLDEPMAGTGREETERLVRLFEGLRGRYAILLVEHDMSAVFALADRISVLVYGKIIATGAPDAIRAHPAVREAYLGEEAA